MSDDPTNRARTIGTSIYVEPPEGSPYLVAEITIDCPVCGQHVVRFAGHHLRAIRDFLIETIDRYPAATLKDGDVHALPTLAISGPGNDPRSS